MKFKHPEYIIVLIYLLVNVLMVFNNGVFIDDWKYVNQTQEDLINCFRPEGWHYTGLWAIHGFICSLPNPMIWYRAITILLWSFSIVWFYRILLTTSIYKPVAVALTLFVAVSPFNFMRFTANTLPYSLSVFLFLGAYLILLKKQGGNAGLNIMVSLMFMYAFITNSVLLFYPIVMLHLWVGMKFKIAPFLKKYYWLFIVPIVFLAIRFTLFVPVENSTSTNYNVIEPSNVKLLPMKSLSLNYGYLLYFVQQIKEYIWLFIVITGFSGIILWFSKPAFLTQKTGVVAALRYALFGVVLFVLAITPYILVNKFPEFKGWETRHQLLIPFGYAFLMAALLFIQNNSTIRIAVLSLICGVFLTAHTSQMIMYYKGWFKYEVIESYFRNHPRGEANTLILNDDDLCSNATDRKISYMEVTGMYKKATGKQDLYIVGKNQKDFTKAQLQEWIDVRRRAKLLGPFNMLNFKTVDGIGTFNIKCARQIETGDLFGFVKNYYQNDNTYFDKTYGDYLEISIGKTL